MWHSFRNFPAVPRPCRPAKQHAYGLFEGHSIEQADARQAYTQSKLGGTPTWVILPRDEWPRAWSNMRNP
eukprot:5029485-Pyramimonas_sp.AAC.1